MLILLQLIKQKILNDLIANEEVKLEELLKINMGEQLQNYFKMMSIFKNLL